MSSYPRETVEFQPITVAVDGAPVTTGVAFSVVAEDALFPDGTRPGAFTAATTLSGRIGVMVAGLAPGTYRVFAQVTSSPETPVIDCGVFTVT